MKRAFPVLLCAFFMLHAGEIFVDFVLEPGDFELGRFGGRDVIHLNGGSIATDEGLPCIPGISYSFLIPQGTSIEMVDVEILASTELEGRYNLIPVQYVPIGAESSLLAGEDPSIFSSDEPFPETAIVSVRSGNKTGFRLGSFCFVPFVYRPLSGKLSVITSARLTIEYTPDPEVRTLALTPMQIEKAANGLTNVVGNPSMLRTWAPVSNGGTDGPSWIVVADSSLQSILEPLVTHRQETAGSAEFVSLQWIYDNVTGVDTQEQIRNHFVESFENQGLVYALIVGDFGETARISSFQAGPYTLNTTADLYFSDLDYNWDMDYDGLYGEGDDGIDYYSDIYVGRFSSDDPEDIEVMVEKTLTYETSAPTGDWRTTAILAGAGLWPENDYWGSFVCDSIANRIPGDWTVHKLYEDPYGHPNNQIELINEGASYMTPQGHGNQAGVYWYYQPLNHIITNSNYTDMTNTDMLPVFHSMACLSGKLQVSSCAAENLMSHPDGGAIAVMFNSNFGWGSPPNMGSSEMLELYFADELFTNNQNEIGVAHALSKDVLTYYANSNYDYWVIQENNLFGDPALLFAAGQTGIESPEPGMNPGLPVISTPVPNPSSSQSVFAFYSPTTGEATISVFDITGRMVRSLHSGLLQAGSGSIAFNGRSESGELLPAGCYTVRIASESGFASTRMVIIR